MHVRDFDAFFRELSPDSKDRRTCDGLKAGALGLVGHCASENAGMRSMMDYLVKRMPGPEYRFLDAGHPFSAAR